MLADGADALARACSSVSFARAWKECDVVVAKGRRNKQVLLDSSHEFTRDCLCFWRDDAGALHVAGMLQLDGRAGLWVFPLLAMAYALLRAALTRRYQ